MLEGSLDGELLGIIVGPSDGCLDNEGIPLGDRDGIELGVNEAVLLGKSEGNLEVEGGIEATKDWQSSLLLFPKTCVHLLLFSATPKCLYELLKIFDR